VGVSFFLWEWGSIGGPLASLGFLFVPENLFLQFLKKVFFRFFDADAQGFCFLGGLKNNYTE